MSATAYERFKDTSVVTVIFNVYTGKSVVTTIDILFISIFFYAKVLKFFGAIPINISFKYVKVYTQTCFKPWNEIVTVLSII